MPIMTIPSNLAPDQYWQVYYPAVLAFAKGHEGITSVNITNGPKTAVVALTDVYQRQLGHRQQLSQQLADDDVALF